MIKLPLVNEKELQNYQFGNSELAFSLYQFPPDVVDDAFFRFDIKLFHLCDAIQVAFKHIDDDAFSAFTRLIVGET